MIFGIILFVLGILVINTFFMAVPYLSPRINHMEIVSYQIFANMLFILFIILPRNMGNFNLITSQ